MGSHFTRRGSMCTEDYREYVESTEDITDERYMEIKKSLN